MSYNSELQEHNEELKAILDEVNALPNATDNVEILLPSEAVAVVGVEFNIYYKSIIRATRPVEDYDIKCYLSDSGVACRRYAECFRLTAVADDIGDHTCTVEVRDLKDHAVIASKTMTLHIIENRAVSGKNVLFIGDSLTMSRNGLYAAEIQYNLSGGGIVSIGTQNGSQEINQIGAVKHEGYNGATCGGFLNENVTRDFPNPFYDPTSGTFDLQYFLTNNGYSKVDAVCLNLGHNNIGNEVAGVADLKTIIQKIHAHDPAIPVLVSLIAPVGDQNAWSANGYSAAQMRYYWRNLIWAYIDAFDRKIDNVYLSTPYFNVDQDNDFPTETVARCARDTEQIVRQTDPMHPTRIGTLKMADSYYAYLLYCMAMTGEEEPEVENLVDPSTANDASPDTATLFKDEWLNGCYLSASSIGALSGCIVTDLFPISYTQTIKVEGILLNTAEQINRFRWYLFNPDGTRQFESYHNFAKDENISTPGTTIVDAANNTAIIDIDAAMGSGFKNIAYARFSCYPAGANEDVIVTVVE